MLAAVLAVALAYLWATIGSALAVWFVAALCAQHASEPTTGASPGREGRCGSRWERLRPAACSGCAYFSAWCGVYLAAAIIALPATLQFVHHESSIGMRLHSHMKEMLIAGSVMILVHLVRRRREALRRARSGVFEFTVPDTGEWRTFNRMVSQRRAASARDGLRQSIEIRWPKGSIEQSERAASVAQCHVLQQDGPLASAIGLTVAAASAISLVRSAGSAQQVRLLDYMVLEFGALLFVSASRFLSLGRLLTQIPRSYRVPIHIIACLSAQPDSLGASDPLASHRGPLDSIARDLRALARRSENRNRYREAVDPHPLVLRGIARYLAHYLASRESMTGRKPEPLVRLLRRSVAVLEGNTDAAVIEKVARTVCAYDEDGIADPELVVRPQRRAVRWGRAAVTQLEQVRQTTTALVAVMLLISAVMLFFDRRLALESLPPFLG